MQVVYERCAGLDVHKKTVVVCAITPDAQGHRHKEWRTFSTMTPDLLRMRDWLKELEVSHVAMESTGSFWKPIFNILYQSAFRDRIKEVRISREQEEQYGKSDTGSCPSLA